MADNTADYFSTRKFRRACAQSGLTKRRIAEALGVTPTTMSSLTSGRTTPSLKLLARIVDFVGGELSDYLELPPRQRWELKHFRIANGYTQAALAKRVGVAPTTVSGWELGNNLPAPESMAKLAELYGVPRAEILAARRPTTGRESAASATAAMELAEAVLEYAASASELAARQDMQAADRKVLFAQVRDRVEQALTLLATLIPQLPDGRRVAAITLVKRLTEAFEELAAT